MGQLQEGASVQLRKELAFFECAIVRHLSQEPDLISREQQSSLRWALSLARLSKIRISQDINESLDLGQAGDRFRAELFALLSSLFDSKKNLLAHKILAITAAVEALAMRERRDLLSLFALRMDAVALDNATRRRPLALTLSGGGGTGFVFLGAFRALEESGIIPDIITGSSMGAILGAYRARNKHFSLEELFALVEKTSWGSIVQPYTGPSRFGMPATFRLYLRDVVGHVFAKGEDFLQLKDLAIPLRVCVAGLSSKAMIKEEKLEAYAHYLDRDLKEEGQSKDKSIIAAILEFAQMPVKAIYLGSDELSKEFDVLDAIGFSAAIPGVFHYDILRKDPHMLALMHNLFEREKIFRLIDGGFVDNLPVEEAMNSVKNGACDAYDPFLLALDSFSPSFTRHFLFYPVMRFTAENSRLGHEFAHLSIVFKNVLSPINIVPTKENLNMAIENGYKEFSPHLSFIRKMIGPIPDPKWLKDQIH